MWHRFSAPFWPHNSKMVSIMLSEVNFSYLKQGSGHSQVKKGQILNLTNDIKKVSIRRSLNWGESDGTICFLVRLLKHTKNAFENFGFMLPVYWKFKTGITQPFFNISSWNLAHRFTMKTFPTYTPVFSKTKKCQKYFQFFFRKIKLFSPFFNILKMRDSSLIALSILRLLI